MRFVWIFLFMYIQFLVLLYCLLNVTPHPQLMKSLTNQELAVLRGLISHLPSPQALSSSLHTVQSGKWSRLCLIHTDWAAASWTHTHHLAVRDQSFSSVSVHLSERQLQQICLETCNVHLTGKMFDKCWSTIFRHFQKIAWLHYIDWCLCTHVEELNFFNCLCSYPKLRLTV